MLTVITYLACFFILFGFFSYALDDVDDGFFAACMTSAWILIVCILVWLL